MISNTVDICLFATCLFILLGSVILTWKTRFVQLRLLANLFRHLKESLTGHHTDHHTIPPHRALFTAMSTTLGIGTTVAPVIAIGLGGPGALIGFLLTAFLGSAATYTEVRLSLTHRTSRSSGAISGGPMQYLSSLFSARAAKGYAIACLVLMMAWSAAQANQLAALFATFHIPLHLSGVVISILVVAILIGGIKRIGHVSAKLVPAMFTLYVGGCVWILIANASHVPAALSQVFTLYPRGLAIGGIIGALRWGIFKGIQVTEAGIGTQTIPHSMAASDPEAQATLAMLSTYVSGVLAFLSGLVVLVTGAWQTDLPLGIGMLSHAFVSHFSTVGLLIIAASTLLFGFGTILGNSYNGSQCFGYLTEHKWERLYFGATALVIFLGTISSVAFIWSAIDLVLVFVAVPHMLSLIRSTSLSRGYLR